MSMSDSDSSQAGDFKSLRQITRERLLNEMLRSARAKDSKSSWKVLIMDKFTVKVMSYACKMADITDEGISLVEDLHKRRQPLPSMDAVYFIQPTKEKYEFMELFLSTHILLIVFLELVEVALISKSVSITMFLSDMSGKSPLYKKAYIFFSSPIQKELVAHIKRDASVIPRIAAMSEVNLEYFASDSQGFITDHERALEELFGENVEGSIVHNECLNTMAIRIATVLASLREFPYVRYRAAKSCLDVSTITTLRDLVPTKLAAAVWNCLAKYRSTIPDFPQIETCELLIVDRSLDQIAPIIHEWTYDAMCHDLLLMDGNKYTHEVVSKTGSVEKKEVLLEYHDPIWVELRHAHIADASERLHDKMTNFVSKNKAAQIHHSARDGGDLSTRDLQKMVQALPQYSEQIDKLSLHVEIAGKINKIIREQGLREIGQLEQDLVFGDATTKELINFLRTHPDISHENKLRLMMIYASICPEKFEGDKASKLMQLAQLNSDDMIAVNNMHLLGGSESKKTTGSHFTLKFDMHKKKHGVRKERKSEEETWQLSRFYPLIEELIEKLSQGELSKEEYPCLNDPSPSFHGTPNASPQTMHAQGQAHSMRSRRTGATWARPRSSDDGYSSDSVLRHASSEFRKMGQRIIIFIIGGATRSELRAVHKLSSKLKREIILGSSSLDDPPQFITKLKMLSVEDISLDDLDI